MWWCVVWCFIFSYHAIILRLIPITSNIWCSLQSTRLIETSIMDFRFHNCHYPLLSSLTLYSRNQNCNNYFHHVKQKYIKQNISRYFIFASHSPGWLVAGCGGGSGIYQMWGDRLQCSELASTWTCRVLSCHVINYIQSHLFTWHQPSQSASGTTYNYELVFALYQPLWVQLYCNVDTVQQGCPTIIELLIRIFCFNVK